MSFNLFDTVKDYFTSSLVSSAATSLGESETGIQKALSGAIPSILSGIVTKSETSAGAAGMLDMAKQAASSGILDNLSGFLGGDNSSLLSKGAEMLKGILGDKAGGIASLVANFSGIKHSSASSILSMAAPVALGALGNHASNDNLSEGGFMNFLASQKNSIMAALPSGLGSVASLLGLGASTSHAQETAHAAAHEASGSSGSLKFLLPLLLGVLAVALAIYIFKGCGKGAETVATEADTTLHKAETKNDSGTHEVVSTVREMFKVTLPDGVVIDAYKGGIEDQLVTFLKSDYKALGEDSLKKVWFDFDNLNFKTGSAEITPESQVQVNNLAAILKAFPAVKLKIGGYTDKTGNEPDNKKLSDARAKAVQAALGKAGRAAQITGAEGYGSEYAKYAKDAPEADHVKDRHVSVSVR